MRGRRRTSYRYRRLGYLSYRERIRRRRRIAVTIVFVVLLLAVVFCGLWIGVRLWRGSEETWEESAVLVPQSMDEETEGENVPGDDVFEPVTPSRQRPQIKVKGIYVTGRMAGSAGLQNLLELVDNTELNTMVIDVKDDEGRITYEMDLDSVLQMGAGTRYIADMEGLMEELKAHDVYTIARIVCFKDPFLAQNRPELALKTPSGIPVTDANGLAWVNPYREEVWEYLADVAKEAAAVGFDEIQFDYVRFPIGSVADAADYGVDTQSYTRQQAIAGFLTYAWSELSDVGVPVAADVFGTIIGSDTDKGVTGQDYARLGEIIDVLCPMVYPSHYGNNVFGLDVPDAYPYETVLAALTGSIEELAAVPEGDRALVRPWLQAFTATWVNGHISYEGPQIRQQIQAVYDAGYEEWILWNATNRYSEDGLELD